MFFQENQTLPEDFLALRKDRPQLHGHAALCLDLHLAALMRQQNLTTQFS
jgi:hypothetical protein